MLPELITPVPGPESHRLAAELRKHESRNITYVSPCFPIFWKRAHGVNVWDVDGNRFLDLTSGFGVAGLGYTPEPVVSAAQEQLRELYHAMGDVHPSEGKVALLQTLSRLTFESWGTGAGKTILCNSGSEAVEAALKTAWMATGRRKVVAFEGSYHGLGYGSLTVTGRTDFRDPFRPQLSDWASFVPFPNAQTSSSETQIQLARQIEGLLQSNAYGAILVEPIQGRGGEIVPPDWFLPLLRQLADRYQTCLIFDEIYTGFYRTGVRFACDHWKTVPDLICLGKALTSGFPLSACIGRASWMDAWPESDGEALHTSTFLGNPLGCRMALASIDELENTAASLEIAPKGLHLENGLRLLAKNHSCFKSVRGKGFLYGMEVMDANGNPDPARSGRLIETLLAEGILILSGGVHRNVLSFAPPFVITREEIDFALQKLERLGSTL